MGQKNHGGRGTGPSAGTPPKKRTASPAATPGKRSVKEGPGKAAGRGKHAAAKSQSVRTSATRKAGPKKTAPRTTTRSADR